MQSHYGNLQRRHFTMLRKPFFLLATSRPLAPALVIILLAGVCLHRANAQQSATKPETVGLSSARLERIATIVQRSVDQGEIAGAVTLVARHGEVVWLRASGKQDRENAKPMRTDSIFRICSMT